MYLITHVFAVLTGDKFLKNCCYLCLKYVEPNIDIPIVTFLMR